MKSRYQFKITQEDDTFIAEGVTLPIVTQAKTLDNLFENIEEAISLYYEDENVQTPFSINLELQCHAKTQAA
jgi:predicted RNase H-like HicB family nuclease